MNAPGSLTHSNKSLQRGSTLYGNGGRRISLRDRDDCSICTSASAKTQKTTNVSRLSPSDVIKAHLRNVKDDHPEHIPAFFAAAREGSQSGGNFSHLLPKGIREALSCLLNNREPKEFMLLMDEMRADLDAQSPSDVIKAHLRNVKDEDPEHIHAFLLDAHEGSQSGGDFSRLLPEGILQALRSLLNNREPAEFMRLLDEMRADLDFANEEPPTAANAGDGNVASVAPADGGDQANDEEAGGSESNSEVVDGPLSVIVVGSASTGDVSSMSSMSSPNAGENLSSTTDTTCASSAS